MSCSGWSACALGAMELFTPGVGKTTDKILATFGSLTLASFDDIYIAAYDKDTTLPTTPGAFQPALKNPAPVTAYDGYIGKISLAPSIAIGGIVPNVANTAGPSIEHVPGQCCPAAVRR
jgi:hypothetical protein